MDPLNGYILLDKPPGITSAAACNRVKRLLPRGTKIGHAGTLDTFATGLLVLLIGKATKQCETMMSHTKVYETKLKLGATTDTDDPDSPEHVTPNLKMPDRPALEQLLPGFTGNIEQTPPAYSALKVGGRRASDRVRDGQSVLLKPRTIRIDSIELLDYQFPIAELRVTCGRGTYIRALARDLGQKLGTGAYLTQLRRTRIGDFGIEQASTLETLQAGGISAHLIPILP